MDTHNVRRVTPWSGTQETPQDLSASVIEFDGAPKGHACASIGRQEPFRTGRPKQVFENAKKIVLHKGVTYVKIDNLALPNLEEVEIHSGMFEFDRETKSLFFTPDKGRRILCNVFSHDDGEYVVPDDVTYIRPYAFSGTRFTSIKFPTRKCTYGEYGDSFDERIIAESRYLEIADSIGYIYVADMVVSLRRNGRIERVELPDGIRYVSGNIRCCELHAADTSLINQLSGVEVLVLKRCNTQSDIERIKKLKNLSRIEIKNKDGALVTKDGVVYSRDEKALVFCPPKMFPPKGRFEIPEGVKVICSEAFKGVEGIRSLHIPDTVTSIGPDAFYGSSIREINIPEKMTDIGNRAFAGMALYEIHFPENIISIGYGAFGHTKCECITLNEGLSYIGGLAFHAMGQKEIILPGSVRMLADSALSGFNRVTLKNNKVHNLISGVGMPVVITDACGKQYFLPSGIYLEYRERLNACWNCQDMNMFDEMYNDILYNIDKSYEKNRIDFALWNYRRNPERYEKYTDFMVKNVWKKVESCIIENDGEKAVDVLSFASMHIPEEKLRYLLSKAQDYNLAEVAAYILQQMHDAKARKEKEKWKWSSGLEKTEQ